VAGPAASGLRSEAYDGSGAILTNQNVIVQGITGHHGAFHTEQMLRAGTNIVAGVTPGKGGETIHGVPVYNSVKETVDNHSATASVIFVPAPFAKQAAFEAMDSGLRCIVIITEGIPVHDMLAIHEHAVATNTTIVGPNCPGFVVPGSHKLGIIASHITSPGSTTVISRSGTLTYELADALTKKGIGQRLILGIGGDPVQGMTFVEALDIAQNDPETRQILLIGEIGGEGENLAADFYSPACNQARLRSRRRALTSRRSDLRPCRRNSRKQGRISHRKNSVHGLKRRPHELDARRTYFNDLIHCLLHLTKQ